MIQFPGPAQTCSNVALRSSDPRPSDSLADLVIHFIPTTRDRSTKWSMCSECRWVDMGIILAPLPELFSLTLIDSPNLRSFSVHASGNKDPASEYYLHVWWALQNATEPVRFFSNKIG